MAQSDNKGDAIEQSRDKTNNTEQSGNKGDITVQSGNKLNSMEQSDNKGNTSSSGNKVITTPSEESGDILQTMASILSSEVLDLESKINKMRDTLSAFKPRIPNIKDLSDSKKRTEIIKYCNNNKDSDHVYFFPGNGEHDSLDFLYKNQYIGINDDSGWCIAGSQALWILFYKIQKKKLSYVPNDVDIFFLNSKRKTRMTLGKVDIVHVKDTSVEKLLLNFDLPCCRAATNSNGDFWVSVQCLASMFNGTYFVPKYLGDKIGFAELIKTYPNSFLEKSKKNLQTPEKLKKLSDYLYDRLWSRIHKYSQRGFNYALYDTDVILPWIISRFDYSEPTNLLE